MPRRLYITILMLACAMGICQEEQLPLVTPSPVMEFLQEKPKISYGQRLVNRYVSKGMMTSPRSRTIADLNINWHGAYFNICSYWDLEGYAKDPEGRRYKCEAVEWDYTFGYLYRFGGDWPYIRYLSLGGDFCKAEIPRNRANNTESYALILATGGVIRTRLRTQWYPKSDDRVRACLTFYYDYPILENLKLRNRLAVWMGNSRFLGTAVAGGVKKAKLYHQTGHPLGDSYKTGIFSLFYTMELAYQFNKHLTFGPMFQIGWAPDHDVREAWEERVTSNSFNTAAGIFLKLEF